MGVAGGAPEYCLIGQSFTILAFRATPFARHVTLWPVPEPTLPDMIAPALLAYPVAPERSRAFDSPWCRAAAAGGLNPWHYDIRTDRLIWSEALRAALGDPELPSAPNIRWWMTRVHPDDVTVATIVYDEVIHGSRDSWVLEYRMRDAVGEWVPVLDCGASVRGPDGVPTALTGYKVVRDDL